MMTLDVQQSCLWVNHGSSTKDAGSWQLKDCILEFPGVKGPKGYVDHYQPQVMHYYKEDPLKSPKTTIQLHQIAIPH